MNIYDRRSLLSAGLVGSVALACTRDLQQCENSATSAGQSAFDLPKLKWKMATSWPKSLETIHGGAEYLAKRVSELTQGQFVIQVFSAGELVPGLQVLDAVQSRTVEMGHTADYYYIGKNSALAFGCAVPFGLNAAQQNAWLYAGGGLELIQNLYNAFGITVFPAGNTGVQMGGWFKKQVKVKADLVGLKMRIPGLGGQVMAKLGVNVQVIPGGEVYLALERGAIDAAEWVGPFDDELLGLNKAAPYYYTPGWWEPGATLSAIINQEAFNALPPYYQAVIKTACAEVNAHMMAKYDVLNQQALMRLKASGTQVQSFSSEILDAAYLATLELMNEMASKNDDFKKIYDHWNVFRLQILEWHQTSENLYMNELLTRR